MSVTVTPLRYPGGKTQLYNFVRNILEVNHLLGTVYCEPFAGGCGLALKLLLNGDVNKIIINDSDKAIYAFWKCVLKSPKKLCEFIDNVDITPQEHEYQRQVYLNKNRCGYVDLAKATLFLNRTNVSGVLKGGMIGGKNQNGAYKLDARFPREKLKEKIKNISAVSQKIELYNLDVFDFLNKVVARKKNIFINFDPPYVKKGGQLYKNSFSEVLHKKLSERISLLHKNWIVTYDICDLIEELYHNFRSQRIDISYSVKMVRKAQEYVFFSDLLKLPKY